MLRVVVVHAPTHTQPGDELAPRELVAGADPRRTGDVVLGVLENGELWRAVGSERQLRALGHLERPAAAHDESGEARGAAVGGFPVLDANPEGRRELRGQLAAERERDDAQAIVAVRVVLEGLGAVLGAETPVGLGREFPPERGAADLEVSVELLHDLVLLRVG